MKAIDFFCGAGGVTCGFKQAGINVLGGIDNDVACKETYEKNNDTKFLHADIRKLKKSSLKNEFGISKNDDELIFIGCSPCQYYTNLKTDKTSSEEGRMLLEDFQKFVNYYKPGYILIENVSGLKKNNNSPLVKFKRLLEKHKYIVKDKIINAKYYGVPQNRRRFVLIATRITENISFPDENKNNLITVKDVIGDTKIFKSVCAGYIDSTDFQHSVAKLIDLNLARIKNTPKDGGDRRSWENNPDLQLECYKNHSGHYDVYGRMKWDKPAPTITTKFRYTSNGRYGHPEQNRAISLREGATLQSFPLNYYFHSTSLNAIGKMIGNAVPPQLAQILGKTIMDNYKYASIQDKSKNR